MNKIKLIVILFALLQVNCWINTKDRSFPHIKTLDFSLPEKPRVYIDFFYNNYLAVIKPGSYALYKKLFKKEFTKAHKKLDFFETVNDSSQADYIISYEFKTIDKSLKSLAGLGIIPVAGYTYAICDVSVSNKDGKHLKQYQYMYRSGTIPHFLFLPLLITPIPYLKMKVTSNWNNIIKYSFKDIIEDKLFEKVEETALQ